jgi:hypothetical protein
MREGPHRNSGSEVDPGDCRERRTCIGPSSPPLVDGAAPPACGSDTRSDAERPHREGPHPLDITGVLPESLSRVCGRFPVTDLSASKRSNKTLSPHQPSAFGTTDPPPGMLLPSLSPEPSGFTTIVVASMPPIRLAPNDHLMSGMQVRKPAVGSPQPRASSWYDERWKGQQVAELGPEPGALSPWRQRP